VAFKDEQVARRQDCTIGDLKWPDALEAEAGRLGALEQESAVIARGIRTVFRDDNQVSGERRVVGGARDALKALIEDERLEIRRHRNGFTARGEAVAPVVETHNLLDTLETDIERAPEFAERLGIEPAARRQRLAVGPKQRRHFRIDDPGRAAILVR